MISVFLNLLVYSPSRHLFYEPLKRLCIFLSLAGLFWKCLMELLKPFLSNSVLLIVESGVLESQAISMFVYFLLPLSVLASHVLQLHSSAPFLCYLKCPLSSEHLICNSNPTHLCLRHHFLLEISP